MSLVAQKFIFDIASDSLQYCKHRKDRGANSGFRKRKSGEEAFVLVLEDLVSSLNDKGINIVKPEYFTGSADEAKTDHA